MTLQEALIALSTYETIDDLADFVEAHAQCLTGAPLDSSEPWEDSADYYRKWNPAAATFLDHAVARWNAIIATL